MDKKYCIVCGCENFSRSKNFCSRKCYNAYYFNGYYNKNKKQILEKNNKWNKDNSKKAKENYKKWKEKNEQYFQEYYLNNKNNKERKEESV